MSAISRPVMPLASSRMCLGRKNTRARKTRQRRFVVSSYSPTINRERPEGRDGVFRVVGRAGFAGPRWLLVG